MTLGMPGALNRFVGRGRVLLILALTAFVTVLDVVTIALIFPIFLIIVRPSGTGIPAPFDSVLGAEPDQGLLYMMGAALVGVVLFKNVAMIFVLRLQTMTMAGFIARVSDRLLRGYLAAPVAFHLPRTTSQYYRGLRDVPVELAMRGGMSYFNRFGDLVALIGMTLALFVIEPLGVTLAMSVLGVLAMANQRYMGRKLRALAAVRAAVTKALYGRINQFVPNVKIVKSTGSEAQMERLIGAEFHELGRTEARINLNQLAVRPLSEIVMLLAGIVIMTALLWDKTRAVEVVPFVAAFTYAIFRMLPAVTRISQFNNMLKSAEPLLEELEADLTATEPFLQAEAKGAKGPTIRFEKSIELRDVGYHYPGVDAPVLRDISLRIEAGEVIGIAGPSGAGKSTLVDILLGLLEPRQGQLLVDGKPPDHDGAAEASVGYVPQATYLLDASARENIAFGEAPDMIDDARVAEAIAGASLGSTIEGLPGGLDGSVGELGNALSGGQRQRFGIARALYRKPSLLVLDEATSDLDNETEYEVSRAISALRGHTTVVLIAHRLHLLKECDRVVFMKDGRIEAIGPYNDLIAQSDGFRQLAQVTDKYG